MRQAALGLVQARANGKSQIRLRRLVRLVSKQWLAIKRMETTPSFVAGNTARPFCSARARDQTVRTERTRGDLDLSLPNAISHSNRLLPIVPMGCLGEGRFSRRGVFLGNS